MSRSVYIIGSKGIPAMYGGFETFVEKLTQYQQDSNIQYYVSCMQENSVKSDIYDNTFKHNNAICFNIKVPNIGPAKAVIYDILALKKAIQISKDKQDTKPIFYILACRIGPFISYFKKEIKKMDGQLIVNPDGHEWLRLKWSAPVRKYWKISEKLMVKNSDLLICDSKNIEAYIQSEYDRYKPTTTYIAYGTDVNKSAYTSSSDVVLDWFEEKKVLKKNYFLVVGRFVPENNFEAMIRQFMSSTTTKDFVIITNYESNKFYEELKKKTSFEKDSRIKFVGTVYNQQLLKYIREQAFCYIHGHEVGGTNPSLLEALSSTDLNLLLDIGFNREVGETGAIYWNKNNLSKKITETENLDLNQKKEIKKAAENIIKKNFTWDYIVNQYERVFSGDNI